MSSLPIGLCVATLLLWLFAAVDMTYAFVLEPPPWIARVLFGWGRFTPDQRGRKVSAVIVLAAAVLTSWWLFDHIS